MDYFCGLGFGGLSVINFGVYIIGVWDEYDEWVRFVIDDSFVWKVMQCCFKFFEVFDVWLLVGVFVKYVVFDLLFYGDVGMFKVGYVLEWECDLELMFDIIKEVGFFINFDYNFGNLIGMLVLINLVQLGLCFMVKDLIILYLRNLIV